METFGKYVDGNWIDIGSLIVVAVLPFFDATSPAMEITQTPSPQLPLEKIQALPPERLAEVEDFVDFLNAKCRRAAALERLLAVAPALEAAGLPAITEEEIQAEINAVRAGRARAKVADRS